MILKRGFVKIEPPRTLRRRGGGGAREGNAFRRKPHFCESGRGEEKRKEKEEEGAELGTSGFLASKILFLSFSINHFLQEAGYWWFSSPCPKEGYFQKHVHVQTCALLY